MDIEDEILKESQEEIIEEEIIEGENRNTIPISGYMPWKMKINRKTCGYNVR